MFNLDLAIQNIIDDLEIKKVDEQANKALAFDIFCNKIINGIESNDESYADITDGGGDYNIDAIHIANNICNIIQCKYYNNTNKSFSLNDLELSLQRIRNFCYNEQDFENYNNLLKEKYKQYKEQSKDINKVNIYFIINGEKRQNKEIENKINQFNSKNRSLEVYLLDINDIRELYCNFIKPKQYNFEYDLNFDIGDNDIDQAIIKHSMDDIKTYTFFIKYNDFISFLETYKEKCGKIDYLFEKNIRNYFDLNSVNNDILETIKDKDKRKFFGLLNNGITMICEYADFKTLGNSQTIKIRQPQIINGQQTARTLFNAYSKNEVKKESNFKIFIRLHEMNKDCLEKHKDIIDLITNTTNNQTPIITADMLSNDKHIIELEDVFNKSNLDIKLIRKRDSHTITNNEIRLEQALKMWYCIYDPVIAKNSKTSIINEVYNHFKKNKQSNHIDEKNDIFYEDVLFCAFLYTKIIKKYKEEYDFIQYCNEMLVYLIYKYIEENKLDKLLLIKEKNFSKLKEIQTEQLKLINNKLKEYKQNNDKNDTYKAIFVSRQFFELFK